MFLEKCKGGLGVGGFEDEDAGVGKMDIGGTGVGVLFGIGEEGGLWGFGDDRGSLLRLWGEVINDFIGEGLAEGLRNREAGGDEHLK